MAKTFRCRGCKYEAAESWGVERCPGCGRYYNIVPPERTSTEEEVSLLSFKDLPAREYIPTGLPELDDVLGGGLVAGSSTMLAGPPGTGKTRILLQISKHVASIPSGTKGVPKGRKGVLYTTGEQNKDDIGQYAHQIDALHEDVRLMADEGDVYKIVDRADEMKPALLIVDSLQTAYLEDVKGDVATQHQLDAIVNWVTSFCKKEKVASILIGHVNADFDFAGGKKVQHLVDCLLYFDRFQPLITGKEDPDEIAETLDLAKHVRELSIREKNRNGPDDVQRQLVMTPEGFRPLSRKQRARFLGLHTV